MSTEIGKKTDKDKTNWWLLPLDVLDQVVRVLEFGAKRYAPDNWKHVTPKERYFSACLRHLQAWQSGEKKDSESGYNHLAHAICCLLFLLWHDEKNSEMPQKLI